MSNLQINSDLVQIRNRSFTSRTAILTHFTCPYKYYLLFEAQGTGLTSNRQSLDLLIGSVVHRGLQHLFEHCRVEHPDGNFEEACVDEAVGVARELWEKSLAKGPLSLKTSDEYDRLDWIIAEQECLWEGLIRAFAIYRLPHILEEYDILEVEFEEVFEGFSPFITFLGKADALFMRKSDKALVVLSIKTTSEYADVTTRDILHDMQGVSETYLAQERISRLYNLFTQCIHQFAVNKDYEDEFKKTNNVTDGMFEYFTLMKAANETPKIFAVQYEYLVKGQRRQDPKDSGEYRQQSFLCHPMKFDSVRRIMLGAGGSSVLNPAMYKWKWGSGRQPNGWNKTDIWNDIGTKTWVTMLATGEIQPELGHPFEHILHTPDLIVRSESELREWYVSTRFKAEMIKEFVEILKSKTDSYLEAKENNEELAEIRLEELQELQWQLFPKNTQSCHDYYGRDCMYVRHCHELESMEDLVTAGDMEKRVPHHKLELDTFIEEGLIEEE